MAAPPVATLLLATLLFATLPLATLLLATLLLATMRVDPAEADMASHRLHVRAIPACPDDHGVLAGDRPESA